MGRKLNLEDIAKLAGVSRSTVSRVINGHPNVSPETRRRVLDVIARENFQPNPAARTLVTSRTQVLGIITPQAATSIFTDPYFPTLIQGVTRVANQHDYAVMLWLANTGEDADPLYRRILGSRLMDGVVVASVVDGDPLIPQLIERDFNFVVVGRPTFDNLNYVDVDNRRAARIAVEHLIRLGRRRIGTITGRLDMVAGQDRLNGYKDALLASGLPVEPELIAEGDFSEASGYVGMKALLERGVDGVFAANDVMAISAMRAIREHGLSIPGDIALVGFDDLPMASAVTPALTTVRQPISRLGEMATEALIRLIEGQLSTPYQAILPTQLVIRDSCGAVTRTGR